MNSLQERDLKYIWHPCSQMKDYENFPPIVIKKGKGAYLYDVEGNSYLDAVSSWWVNLFGHSNQRINKAINEQVEKLEHVIFANFSHEAGIDLAEKIVNITPKGLNKVFFSDNGSASIEVALKMSFQYHQQIGNTKKTKFLALTDAYHGETLGALSVGDLDLYSKVFNPLLLNTFRAKGPDCYRCPFGKTRDNCEAECFINLEKMVEENEKEICAVIVEPLLQCAAGMKMYPPIYLKKLRALCTKYKIHLIADEIAAGFGRTGKMFACNYADITPDIMCISKGLTAGYLPLALTVVRDEMYDAFYSEYNDLKAFMHSHSYTGNPIACRIACETLNIFNEENIIEENKVKAEYINSLVKERINNQPYIGEYRQLGMVGAIELVEDKMKKKGFDWKKRVGYEIYKLALKKGVLLRPLGNVIYFMPPYIVEKKDINLMVNTAFESMEEYFKNK